MEKLRKVSPKIWLVGITGFLIGALTLVTVHFANYKTDTVHYHANVALYVNGAQDKFEGPGYYEEVQACGSDMVENPRSRVHLHDNKPTVVHVHDHGVTWGHFFANLGYGLTNKAVITDSGVYVDGENDVELQFVLNGKEVGSIANRHIESEDALVVWVGKTGEDAAIPEITRDAGEYNKKNDPATCTGTKKATYWERLKQSFGF